MTDFLRQYFFSPIQCLNVLNLDGTTFARYEWEIDGMSDVPRQRQYSSLTLQELVGLCAGPRDDQAWAEFVSRVGKPIDLIVTRTASSWGRPSRALVQDLVQTTLLKLWDGGRRLLHEFSTQHPEAILGYIKRIAANTTHDYFKHVHSQSSGGLHSHVSTSDVEPEAGHEVHGSAAHLDQDVFLQQVDDALKRRLSGADGERDRTIFWLYFRQGMSTQEIASLPAIGLSAKGVGSVIERLKHALRDEILGERRGETNGTKVKSLGNSY